MKKIKIILIAIFVLTALSVLLTGINILQKGGSYNGKTIQQILSVPADKATASDVKKLGKADVFQLFYAAPAPALSDMKGEYRGETLDVGIMAGAAAFFTHNFFGPGRWHGKAFHPFSAEKGAGYNIFISDNSAKPHRTRKIDTFIAKSLIDDKPSFHIVYSAYNSGPVHSMRDEIRKINDNLYIGMGHMALGGGRINPAPFILTGPPEPWVSADIK